ncbi:MAG: CocE/NonD family hydrolase [Proteobacteria bacterium]|nr:CocE/NonD family hydrolase [Pseudomonadota bacterium]
MRALLAVLALLVAGRAAACESASLPAPAPTTAQYQAPAAYTLTRQRIQMRDGACLDTFILAPREASRPLPILLVRTPYDPTAQWILPEAEFQHAGYVFVTQSARGRYGSEGAFVQMRPHNDHKRSRSDIDESSDTFDTIDWLVRNVPNNNGRVGLRGISYNGFYAAAGMIDAHPALKAVSPQAPQVDWFLGDDTHHNGAFLLASTFNFMMSCDRRSAGLRVCAANFEPPTTDGYHFFLSLGPLSNIERQYFHGDSPEWQLMMRHGTYDRVWQERNLLPHLRSIQPAVLAVSGWYDANNLYGALHVFASIRRNSPDTTTRLVVGPWTHAQWVHDGGESIGPLQFGSATATDFIHNLELPFFESYLKGDGRAKLPVANVFDTGRNQWGSFNAWPPKEGVKANLCLGTRGSLRLLPACDARNGYDEYVSDPRSPVPFVPDHGVDMDADYMTRDQRFTSGRHDVVSYESEVLATDVTVAGPLSPRLVVSTSGTDSDWVVKLIDQRPDGFQQLVRGDVMRGKFRSSFTSPAPMRPNEATAVDFTMNDVYHTFRKGHRILVQVQSSWFPLVDLNPQRFLDIYSARAADFQSATQRVYHGSRIEMTVLPGLSAHRADEARPPD